MSEYMTKASECTGTVSVFARPNDGYDPENPESKAFSYVLREGTSHWNDRYVLVVSHEVTLGVPSGVNLVQKAVETLRNKIQEKKDELADDILKLEKEIAKLALITYIPGE